MTQLLCSLERVKMNLPKASIEDDRIIAALLAAVSQAIRDWCRRSFTLQSHDEWYDGVQDERLILRHSPVLAIDFVRHSPQVVLEVINTDAANQQARAAIHKNGIELIRVTNGILHHDNSITFEANPTVQSISNAIGTLSGGWSARVIGEYGNWPAIELHSSTFASEQIYSQGPFDCRQRYGGFSMHVGELTGYRWDARGWLWREAGWVGGSGHWRVRYSAGYVQIPESVVEACAQWTSMLFEQTRRDPALAALAVSGAVSQSWLQPGALSPPSAVAALLAPYRRYVIG